VLRVFQANRVGVLLLIPVLAGIYYALNDITGCYELDSTSNLGLLGKFTFEQAWIPKILAPIIVCINAFAISWIYNENTFYERNTYTSALLYVVCMSFYHSFYSLDGLLLAHSCIIILLYQYFLLRQNEDGRKHAFNGAFFGGLAAVFHPPLIALLPVLLMMLWSLRPFVFREMVLVILGFGLPLLYGAAYLWYAKHSIELQIIQETGTYYKKQTDFLITSALFSLLFMLSMLSIRSRMQKSSSRLKNLVRILWFLVLIAVILGLADYFLFNQIERFSLLTIPLSFFLTFAFNRQSNKGFEWVSDTLFYLTFAYSLTNYFL
jgi:hypothetical protein